MTTTQNSSSTIQVGTWESAEAWVADHFPTAKLVGMGTWKVARTVTVYYGIGRLVVTPMRGHELSEFGL